MSKKKKGSKKKSGKKGTKSSGLRRDVLEIFLKNAGKPLNYKQVASRLGIDNQQERNLLASTLHQLKESGELKEVDRGKFKIKRLPRAQVVGKVDMTASGAAYVVCEGVNRDIYVSPRKVRNALHGDMVKISVAVNNRGGKLEGEVIEVLERAKSKFVGKLQVQRDFGFLIADDQRMNVDIFIGRDEMNGAQDGDKVIVEMTDWPERAKNPFGRVIMVLGKPGDNDTEMHSILADFDFPLNFPENVEAEAEAIPLEISKEEIEKRRDMRDVPTFTIDPDDAKDFDDAISVQQLENGHFEIGVHIADVSHYVTPGTKLDDEAYSRATSIYLVDRVIPMLPEKLSNGVCSLRPNEEKLTFSAVFEMDLNAKVYNSWFGRTVTYSDKRFTYNDAQAIIEGGEGDLKEEVLTCFKMSEVLRKARFDNGALAFEKDEVKFRLDDKGNPTEVFVKEYKESNKLVEEFMLLANRKVAEWCGKDKNKNPRTYVYRIHDEPSQERLETLVQIAGTLDHQVKLGPRKVLTSSLNKLLKEIKGTGEENMLSTLTIRCMAKAEYSTENIGHYGLGFQDYTHFTSPIRRYPDVIAHRLLQRYLDEQKSLHDPELEKQCQHCSEMEKKATEAERASTKFMQSKYLADHVGEQFEGLITGVTEWGVYVELKENRCEGMIRLRDMDDDFYAFDEKTMTVTGSLTGNSLRLGDEVNVRVRRVSVEKRQIDLELMA